MTQRKKTEDRRQNTEVEETAEALLSCIAWTTGTMKLKMDEFNAMLERVSTPYKETMEKLQAVLIADEKSLISLMKKNKAVLFDGTDIVNLPPGSLIHNVADKVTIPKTALAECKAQGFQDVIKIVESLDREAIEKWPDAKLVLIGATKKPKEEFSYNLKVEEQGVATPCSNGREDA